LLHAPANVFYLAVKLTGRVILGKELIELMPTYENKDIPVTDLFNMIFAHMIHLVRVVALSGILEGKGTTDGYNSILKSIRKLTLFMLRALIVKAGMQLNAFNLNEIRKDKALQIKNSIFAELLRSYDEIELNYPSEARLMGDVQKCILRVLEQFNRTISLLAGINYPLVTLPNKLTFHSSSLLRRLEYGMYLLVTNAHDDWNKDLFKLIFVTLVHPEDISLRFYNLFVSSVNLINCKSGGSDMESKHRQAWLRLYDKSLQPWKYDIGKSVSVTQSEPNIG
jgi:hypothetical protein